MDVDAAAQLKVALADRYRIEREIGAGGMATVYLARDVRHDRQVALKVLKPELAAVIGAERFLQEIKVTANLHHPHILPLHDSGQVTIGQPDLGDGSRTVFYVMPYVAGESLRARLDRERQLPIDAAVRITTEVASALHYAHRQGVIHRDIKPDNILLHDDSALVADFGIALAVSSAGGSRLTETGLSLGTPQYMSPEQAMGEREITAKSDVYALGCVLYAMLVGEPPFVGPTAQATIARMLTEEPRPPRLERKAIPPNVEQAVLTALARLPADRFETAAQFIDALQDKRPGPTTGVAWPSARAPSPRPVGRRTQLLVGATLVLSVLMAGVGVRAWMMARGAPPPQPVRFALALPTDAPLLQGSGSLVLFSPDGNTLVYRVQAAGSGILYRRQVDQLTPTPIAGTEGAVLPFLSPDGRWVAFFTGGQLKKVPIEGGPAATITALTPSNGASWGPNDVLVLGSYPGSDGLSRTAASGGTPTPFTKPDSANGELSQRWPRVLPDGKTVLYSSWGSGGLQTARIGIASLETGQTTILDVAGSYPFGIYLGQLIYARADGALMAVPFDLRDRRVTGAAMAVLEGASMGASGASRATISEGGALAYVTGAETSSLVRVSLTGAMQQLTTERRAFDTPRFSPDGKRIAVTIQTRPPDIWIYDVAAGTLSRLTTEAANLQPEWSPDGSRVIFLSNRSGEMGVWWRQADGSTPPHKAFESRDEAQELAVAPDGSVLVYRLNQSGGNYGLRFSSFADMTTPTPFVSSPVFHELMPSLSPDGRWLAHVSDETGALEVYVRPFPGPGARYLVSAGGGSEPHWAPDGRRLFYRNGRQMLAVRVTTSPAFSVTQREVLFEGGYATSASHQSYDVAPDGQGFVMLQPDAAVEVAVVLNWFTELRNRIRANPPQ